MYAKIQEEFAMNKYIKLPKYHMLADFTRTRRFFMSKDRTDTRGRGILVQTGEHEFYLAGANIGLNFIRRPEPSEENLYPIISSRQATQLNYLSVEEGYFENGEWVVDFCRNGDQANYDLCVRDGEIVRIRLNPYLGYE